MGLQHFTGSTTSRSLLPQKSDEFCEYIFLSVLVLSFLLMLAEYCSGLTKQIHKPTQFHHPKTTLTLQFQKQLTLMKGAYIK